MDVRKILIPTDLSDESKSALLAADIFIELFDCKVDVMHVIPLSKYLTDSLGSIGMPINMSDEVYPKLIKQKQGELQDFADAHIKNKDKKGDSVITVDRKPSDSIAKRAKEGDYDLIMMSSAGSHKSDFFHGSITDKIIRKSPVPVLTLPENLSPKDINRILVPCDFSDHSLAAIPVAYELAEKFEAEIELLHIIELYAADIHGIKQASAGVDKKTIYQSLRDKITSFLGTYDGKTLSLKDGEVDYFDEIVRKHEDGSTSSIHIKTVIAKAVAAHHEIIDYANNESDMVVMSTHGRTGLSHMLLGSTTEQVIQQIKKPQLTIKPDFED